MKLTDEQKQEIIHELEKVCDGYEKNNEIYKSNSLYLADVKYTKAYLKAQEDNIKYVKNFLAKIKSCAEIDEGMWTWILCLLAIIKPNEDKE